MCRRWSPSFQTAVPKHFTAPAAVEHPSKQETAQGRGLSGGAKEQDIGVLVSAPSWGVPELTQDSRISIVHCKKQRPNQQNFSVCLILTTEYLFLKVSLFLLSEMRSLTVLSQIA